MFLAIVQCALESGDQLMAIIAFGNDVRFMSLASGLPVKGTLHSLEG